LRSPPPTSRAGALRRRFVRRRGGVLGTVTLEEAVVKALGRRALKGDVAAAREVLKLAREAAAAEAAEAEAEGRRRGPEPVNYGHTPTIMERVLVDLGGHDQG